MNCLPSYFRLAAEASTYSEHHQHKMGAAIFIKGKPIAVGFNKMKTHPNMGLKTTIHAELAAIMSVKNKNRLVGASIIVYRKRRNGTTGLARPCSECQKILQKYGFKEYIFTTNDGYRVEWPNKNQCLSVDSVEMNVTLNQAI